MHSSRPCSITDPGGHGQHRSGGAYLLRGRSDRQGGAHAHRSRSRARSSAGTAAISVPNSTSRTRSTTPGVPRLPRRPSSNRPPHRTDPPIAPAAMTFENGLGGFTDEGRAYAIVLQGDQETASWVNVIANASFGTIVTASGSTHTWSENSRENRLTPFANDPIVDPTAEAFFIRDDESGDAWSPTPGPMVRHPRADSSCGPSFDRVTRFSRVTRGIRHELAGVLSTSTIP